MAKLKKAGVYFENEVTKLSENIKPIPKDLYSLNKKFYITAYHFKEKPFFVENLCETILIL